MAQFDPLAFLNQTTTEQGSIISVPIPVGEYTAVIEKVEARPWQGKADPSKSGIALDVVYNIDDAGVKTFLGRDKVTITQGIMVDLDSNDNLDYSKGKNISLNRVREATGLNVPGAPFAPRMLEGKVAKIAVGHRASERPQDPPGTMFADVLAVSRG